MPKDQITPLNPYPSYVSVETEDCILTLLDDCQLVKCAARPRQQHVQQAHTAGKGKAAKSGGKIHHIVGH